KRAYCLKTQPATGETYPKSDLFNKAAGKINLEEFIGRSVSVITKEVVKSRETLLKLDIMTW
ncbi:hypothetical protein, partial [Enterobacter roggenkampii]|uniref:hypothetical protein n=1 Tax=Enterobacter roggenkampii TaxID=1812935 RepID=UPI002FFC9086